MLRVGLTGGMGAGKSSVAKLLESHGAIVIDSDLVAREVVAPGTAGLAALVRAFGPDILLADGRLNRPVLAAMAFGDPGIRAELNAITHPLVGARTAELVAEAPADSIVVQDIPLLVENGLGPLFNLVIVVDVPAAERVRRLVSYRGISEVDAQARIAAQASDEQRRAAADVLLDNTGSPDSLRDAVAQLWAMRLEPYARNIQRLQPVEPRPIMHGPSSRWPEQAQRLLSRLRLLAGPAAMRVDHIGSTAVPAMPGQDIIDAVITLRTAADADAVATALTTAGFPPAAERRVHASADPGRPAYVYLQPEQAISGQARALREWLTSDSVARTEFAGVKRQVLAEIAPDADDVIARRAYSAAKNEWVRQTAPRRAEWIERTAKGA